MDSQKCTHCGSDRLVHDVKVYCDSGSNFPLRAQFPTPKKSAFRPFLPEYFYSDLCSDCGTVVRMYVRQPHDAWETGPY